MAIAMAGGATRAGAGSLLLLLLVALAGGASATVAAFSGIDNTIDSGDAAALLMTPKPLPPSPEELTGFMECLLGCFTQVFGCSFGCMAKGPDLPLCVISCDQKSVVCMIRCGLSPSPPGPKPPGPKPPGPKPPSPKPPAPKPPPPTPAPPTPGPPYTPPYAATGRKIATYA